MQIDKDQILGMLRERGDDQKAQEADRELPDQVDPERDSGLLQRFGIDPQELISKFMGGKSIPGL
jgi:hypothetical protein